MNGKINNVKQQIAQSMLREKHVKYQQDIFEKYFDDIFPETVEFQRFLSTSGWDTMVDHGKRIFDRLLFDSSWNGMQNMLNNMLDLEARELTEKEDVFVSQSHTIHSIHLYLLGLYLYFNYGVFHDALNRYFENVCNNLNGTFTDEKSFLCFFNAWKAFSLLHDLAYPYEVSFNGNGIFNKKNKRYLNCFDNMEVYMAYEESLKYYSEMILLWIIIEDSIEGFAQETYGRIKDFSNLERQSKLSTNELFKNRTELRKLAYIHTDKDFQWLCSLLDIKKYVVIGKNKHRDISILSICNNNIRENYSKNGKIKGHGRKKCNNKLFDYYVQDNLKEDFDNLLYKLNLVSRKEYFQRTSRLIKHEIMNELASTPENISFIEIIYKIRKYLQKFCTEKMVMNKDFSQKKPDKLITESRTQLYENILCNFKQQLNRYLPLNQEPFYLNDFNKVLKEISEIDLATICINSKETYYREKKELKMPILECVEVYQKIYSIYGDVQKKNNRKFYDNMDITDIVDYADAMPLLKSIGNMLVDENFIDDSEDVSKVLKYKTDYFRFDHGIMAGIIASKFLVRKEKLVKDLEVQDIRTNLKIKEQMESYYQALYAILVHNIYNNLYFECCGKMPVHNLLVNPFCYFAMFCDNLQVWDRNKSINHGMIKWTGKTLYGEDICIDFEENQIVIRCKTDDINWAFSKLKKSLETYLKGAEKLVSLVLSED